MNQIAEIIITQTGLELITLESIPRNLLAPYHILNIEDEHTHKNIYYLFWKPSLRVTNYFDGSRGNEIKKIQTLLKNLNLYHYKIDGIAGPKCTAGLVEFQKQNKLVPSGFPDSSTVFLLTILTDSNKL